MTNQEVIERLSYLIEDGDNGINGLALDALNQALAAIKSITPQNWANAPSWSTAPDWANWLAQDKDGDWYWFENKPLKKYFYWDRQGGRLEECDILDDRNWEFSLQQRPENKDQ